MKYVDSFLEDLRVVRERPFTEGELAGLADEVPAEVVGFLAKVGKGAASDFYFTQLPSENHHLLKAWGIDPEKAHLFMTSALGLLAFATKDVVYSLNPHTGHLQSSDPHLAFALSFMEPLTFQSEAESRDLASDPLRPGEMWGIFPPIRLGGKLGNVYGGKPTVSFRKVSRDEHNATLASLCGNKVKGLPKALQLPKPRGRAAPAVETPPSRVAAVTPPERVVAFGDPGMRYAVVSALFGLGAISHEQLHAVLREHGEAEGDELEHIARAVKALRKLALTASQVARVQTIGRDLAFEGVFEQLIGVETGGEDDYMAIGSLRDVGSLPGLEHLDLASVTFDSRKPPDLAPLAGHPSLRAVVLGPELPKKLTALAAIPGLTALTLPRSGRLPPALRSELARRGVTISAV